jgi:AbrB family looped-hinge helix DNA binding protein
MSDLTTTLTERGQISIPSAIRKDLHLKPGQKLHWQKITEHECRITISPGHEVPGPLAMLGKARRFRPNDHRSTDEIMRELREGETI